MLFSFICLLYELAHLVELLELFATCEYDEGALLYFEIRWLALAPTERTNARDNPGTLNALCEAANEADCVLVIILFDFCVYRRHRRYLTIKDV